MTSPLWMIALLAAIVALPVAVVLWDRAGDWAVHRD